MSDVDPEFLELADVFELHADSIARYGGDLGVRDRGLIESAVAVPRQSFDGEYVHTTLFEMAAAYAFHVAESQGFVDGNKRAGLAAATAFLAMNGHDLLERDERLYAAMIAISPGPWTRAGWPGCSRSARSRFQRSPSERDSRRVGREAGLLPAVQRPSRFLGERTPAILVSCDC